MTNRIAVLSDKLKRIADAKQMLQTQLWAEAWDDFEQELLERLLKCGPDDEVARWKLQMAIEAARHTRRVIENSASGESGIVKELDILEGRKASPIV